MDEEDGMKFLELNAILSRTLPLWFSRSPVWSSLRTPVTIVKRTNASSDSPVLHHLPDYLPYICHSSWFLPQALLFLFQCFMSVRYSCFLFCSLCYLLLKSLPVLASRHPASTSYTLPQHTVAYHSLCVMEQSSRSVSTIF
jgi:hypothetical protein